MRQSTQKYQIIHKHKAVKRIKGSMVINPGFDNTNVDSHHTKYGEILLHLYELSLCSPYIIKFAILLMEYIYDITINATSVINNQHR